MGRDVAIRILEWPLAGLRVMPLRERVFVVEQGVPPEMELDEHDPTSLHALAETDTGLLIGTGRLLPDGHIGRMAVDAEWRGRGIGGRVLEALVAEAAGRGLTVVVLNAQVRASEFYRRHGFVAEGGIFMDAGIPHRAMRRRLG